MPTSKQETNINLPSMFRVHSLLHGTSMKGQYHYQMGTLFTIKLGLSRKTIVVHYFDSFSQCWRVCSRRITICPPITCENAIDYTFNAATNSYHFSLNIPGASSISWQFDDNHTQIPNGEFVLPADGHAKAAQYLYITIIPEAIAESLL